MYRLKTEEELFREFGEGWERRGHSIVPEMLPYLGMDLPTDVESYIRANNLQLDTSDYFLFAGYNWHMWALTYSIPKHKTLYSAQLLNFLISNDTALSLSLAAHKTNHRGKDHIKNLHLRNDGKISYSPAGKDSKPENPCYTDEWSRKGRQMSKPGRVLAKLCKEFGIGYSDSEMEQLVNYLKAMMKEDEFEIVEGEDIKTYYHYSSYDNIRPTGSLGNSCMRHDECQNYLDIYVKNPEVCKMVVLKNAHGRITGRALLWETNLGTFMDRVYGSDSTITKFIEYAKENDWMYRTRQSSEDKEYISKNGKDKKVIFQVKLSLDNFDKYPYLDTLTYMSSDGFITNDNTQATFGIMNQTNGTICKTVICFITKRAYSESECYLIDSHEHGTVNVHRGQVLQCNVSGQYHLPEDMVDTRSRGKVHKYSNLSELIYVETDDCWEFIDQVFTCAYDNKVYCIEGAVRWSFPSRTVQFDDEGNEVHVHIDNLQDYLKIIGKHIVDEGVLSKATLEKLNIKLA